MSCKNHPELPRDTARISHDAVARIFVIDGADEWPRLGSGRCFWQPVLRCSDCGVSVYLIDQNHVDGVTAHGDGLLQVGAQWLDGFSIVYDPITWAGMPNLYRAADVSTCISA